MGLHPTVGSDSAISILRKNKIGEVKLAESIFSFLHPATGKKAKTTTNATEPGEMALARSPVLDSIENQADEKTHTGIVEWFNNSKGFGYIKSDQGQSLFVHFKNIGPQTDDVSYRSLSEGDRVQFILGQRRCGNKIFPCAVNVFVIDASQEKEHTPKIKGA